jgi:hypothetical protein
MKMSNRAYRRDTRRLPKWKELKEARIEQLSFMTAKYDNPKK